MSLARIKSFGAGGHRNIVVKHERDNFPTHGIKRMRSLNYSSWGDSTNDSGGNSTLFLDLFVID